MQILANLLLIAASHFFGLSLAATIPSQPAVMVQEVDKAAFAQCLTKNDFVFYGLDTCVHCNEQKALFGDAFKKLKYIECRDDFKVCAEKNVTNVPTWVYPQGRSVGVQSFEELALLSGCKLK